MAKKPAVATDLVVRIEPGNQEYDSLFRFWDTNGRSRQIFDRAGHHYVAINELHHVVFVETGAVKGSEGFYKSSSVSKL